MFSKQEVFRKQRGFSKGGYAYLKPNFFAISWVKHLCELIYSLFYTLRMLWKAGSFAFVISFPKF